MFSLIILGLAVVVLYNTAGPLLYLRSKLTAKLDTGNKIDELCSTIINCTTCSSFYIAGLVYMLKDLIPDMLSYMIIVCAIVTLVMISYYELKSYKND